MRVLIVNDYEPVRRGLMKLIGDQSDIDVVGEAEDGAAAIARIGELRPDLVLMDIRMPVLSGIEATRVIHAAYPAVRILGVTAFAEAKHRTALLEAGAEGLVSMGESPAALLAAIRACGGSCRPAV